MTNKTNKTCKNIYLIGYRCTGKTSVGKALADKLGKSFIDTDEKIVETLNKSIAQIVSESGWEKFREKERNFIKGISGLMDLVVATGGGAILDKHNVFNMKKKGIVVWLKANPETIKRRMEKDKTSKDYRPSLTNKNILDEVYEVLNSREPYYMQAMDFYVDTDEKTIDGICDLIFDHLKRSSC
jgi:shikimate kinase